MQLHLPHLILLLISIQVFIGCQKRSESIRLDHYGEFENTELTIQIENITDSVHLNIRNYQELFGLLEFDTNMVSTGDTLTLRKRLTLERPTPILISIDNISREVFLIPGLNNDFTIESSSDSLTISFEDSALESINLYQQSKARIGGDMRLSQLMPKVISLGSQEKVFHAMDSLRSILIDNMNNQNQQLKLPGWFLQYERSEIDYLAIGTKTFASRVRRIIFNIDDSVDSRMNVDRSQFNPEDDIGFTTTHFLPALPLFAGSKMDTFDIFDLDLYENLDIRFERARLISDIRIRDVFLSHLFFTAVSSSFAIPDTLLIKIKNGISDNMQGYAARIENTYNQFNGTPAPPFYLKDLEDNEVSLHDFRGNVLLLDFWFIGCRFCREDLPYTKQLIEDFQNENFKVLQICMQSELENWKKQKELFAGETLYSNSGWDKKLTNDYQIQGYPRYVLIDEEGIILEGWCERPSDPALEKRIRKYFDKE